MPRNSFDEHRFQILNKEPDELKEANIQIKLIAPTRKEIEAHKYSFWYIYENPNDIKGWRNDPFRTYWDCKSHWSFPMRTLLRRKIDKLNFNETTELHRWATQLNVGDAEGQVSEEERVTSKRRTLVEYFLKPKSRSENTSHTSLIWGELKNSMLSSHQQQQQQHQQALQQQQQAHHSQQQKQPHKQQQQPQQHSLHHSNPPLSPPVARSSSPSSLTAITAAMELQQHFQQHLASHPSSFHHPQPLTDLRKAVDISSFSSSSFSRPSSANGSPSSSNSHNGHNNNNNNNNNCCSSDKVDRHVHIRKASHPYSSPSSDAADDYPVVQSSPRSAPFDTLTGFVRETTSNNNHHHSNHPSGTHLSPPLVPAPSSASNPASQQSHMMLASSFYSSSASSSSGSSSDPPSPSQQPPQSSSSSSSQTLNRSSFASADTQKIVLDPNFCLPSFSFASLASEPLLSNHNNNHSNNNSGRSTPTSFSSPASSFHHSSSSSHGDNEQNGKKEALLNPFPVPSLSFNKLQQPIVLPPISSIQGSPNLLAPAGRLSPPPSSSSSAAASSQSTTASLLLRSHLVLEKMIDWSSSADDHSKTLQQTALRIGQQMGLFEPSAQSLMAVFLSWKDDCAFKETEIFIAFGVLKTLDLLQM